MTAIRITRNLVSTDSAMEGKKVRTLDGELRTITGCPSGTSYSVEGTRARVYAYLIVKDGRHFKEITADELENKVAAATDMGGYAKYTMLGKRAPKADNKPSTKPGNKPADNKPGNKPADNKPGNKPADNKPGTKPRTPKADNKPGTKPRTPKADNKPADSKPRTPKADNKPSTKPAAGGTRVKRAQPNEFEQSIINAGRLTKPAGKILRDMFSDFIRDNVLVLPDFAGLYNISSESTVGEPDGDVIEVRLQLDISPYLGLATEGSDDEPDTDAMFDALLAAGYTSKDLRRLTDEELIDLYRNEFDSEGSEEEAEEEAEEESEEEAEEFEEEEAEEEEEPETESVELMQVHLPSTIFRGVKQIPAGDELDACYAELASVLGVDEIWSGVVLQHEKDESYWVYAGMVTNKDGEPRALLTSYDAVENSDEDAARKARKLVSISLMANYAAVVDEAEEEEENEPEEFEEENEPEEFEEDELQMDFDA